MVQRATEVGAPPHAVYERTAAGPSGDAGSTQVTGRSSGVFGGRTQMDSVSPAAVAARVTRRATTSPPTASTGTGTRSGSAPMGGRTPAKDLWGDGMINEADRGGAHDYGRVTPQVTIG